MSSSQKPLRPPGKCNGVHSCNNTYRVCNTLQFESDGITHGAWRSSVAGEKLTGLFKDMAKLTYESESEVGRQRNVSTSLLVFKYQRPGACSILV